MIDDLRAEFLRLLTVNSKTRDRRRRDYNLAIFADHGGPIWNRTSLYMIMDKFDRAVKEVSR